MVARSAFGYFSKPPLIARASGLRAVVFVTLPGASLSSLLISTDVPLLCSGPWPFIAGKIKSRSMVFAVLIGATLDLGLLAKYAAIYFLLCVGIDARSDARAGRGADLLKGYEGDYAD